MLHHSLTPITLCFEHSWCQSEREVIMLNMQNHRISQITVITLTYFGKKL